MTKLVGFDLGGTRIKAAVVDVETGVVSGIEDAPTIASEGHEAVIGRMIALIERVIAGSGVPREAIQGIGIGVPGVLDLECGLTLFLPNLPGTWPGVPLRDRVAAATGLPTHLLNDARAMTLGEWSFGAGRGVDTMACFTLGTGIGGGLVVNGQLHLGIGGTAGELGHQIVELDGLTCGCGSRGCLEAYASGPAIVAMGLKAVTQGLTTRIGELAGYDLNRITPETITQAALQGDAVALEIYERAGYYLGIAISNVMVMIGPRKVVIGGGVAQAGELLFGSIRRTVNERVRMMPKEKVKILTAELGTNAGLIGAAVWAQHHL